jgi:hypothetical protein
MIDLGCALISLKPVGLTIVAEYLDRNFVLFHNQGLPQQLDLRTGVVRLGWTIDAPDMKAMYDRKYLSGGMPMDEFVRMSDLRRANDYRKMVQIDARRVGNGVIAFISTLASHQVGGDELVKGLKALNFDTSSMKFTKRYTGGWRISQELEDGVHEYTAESVANYLQDQLDQRD